MTPAPPGADASAGDPSPEASRSPAAPDGNADRPRALASLLALVERDARLSALAGRFAGSVAIGVVKRFRRIGGRDRVLILAGQAFTALIPLLVVAAAFGSDDALGERVATRFELTGGAREAVVTLFSRPPGMTGGITLLGIVVLLFSVLSFTRSLQRTYEAAWDLPSAGVRGTVNGLSGVALLLAQILALSLLTNAMRGLPAADAFTVVVQVVLATLLWWELQFLLLSRRVERRQLIPGALVAGTAQAAVALYSTIWMPHLMTTNAERYGVIGITFALLTWLIVVAAGMVATAVVSAEVGERTRSDGDDPASATAAPPSVA